MNAKSRTKIVKIVIPMVIILLFSSVKSFAQTKDIKLIRSFLHSLSQDSISEKLMARFLHAQKTEELEEIKKGFVHLKNSYSEVFSKDSIMIINKDYENVYKLLDIDLSSLKGLTNYEVPLTTDVFLFISIKEHKIFSIMTYKQSEHEFVIYL